MFFTVHWYFKEQEIATSFAQTHEKEYIAIVKLIEVYYCLIWCISTDGKQASGSEAYTIFSVLTHDVHLT